MARKKQLTIPTAGSESINERATEKQQDEERWAAACEQSAKVLASELGKLVAYYDGGWRSGFLMDITKATAVIQPIGVFKGGRPNKIRIPLPDIKPNDGAAKSIDDYAKEVGWDKATAPVLLVAGATKMAAAVNKAVAVNNMRLQAAAADTTKALVEGDVTMVVHDEYIIEKPTFAGLDLAHHKEVAINTAHDELDRTNAKLWNPERAVELFKAGMKIVDIAVEMGYPRGSGQNRTKQALKKAGVLA